MLSQFPSQARIKPDLFVEKLSKYTTNTPHVHFSCILGAMYDQKIRMNESKRGCATIRATALAICTKESPQVGYKAGLAIHKFGLDQSHTASILLHMV